MPSPNKFIMTNRLYDKTKISLVKKQAVFLVNDKKIIALQW
jgi:hypothetical protein